MKSLNEYITEKLKVSKKQYNYYPQTREELDDLLNQLLKERGWEADLNDIDVSNITDFSELFLESEFDGDISMWNMTNAKYTDAMFYGSNFTGKNGDISNWDVSNIVNMRAMFKDSAFDEDLSKWKLNSRCDMDYMFAGTFLEDNLPKWFNGKIKIIV